MATSVQPTDYGVGLNICRTIATFSYRKEVKNRWKISQRREKEGGGGGLKQISAAERQIVSSAVDVSDSYLARLDPALPLLTSKSEPGDDGNRK